MRGVRALHRDCISLCACSEIDRQTLDSAEPTLCRRRISVSNWRMPVGVGLLLENNMTALRYQTLLYCPHC